MPFDFLELIAIFPFSRVTVCGVSGLNDPGYIEVHHLTTPPDSTLLNLQVPMKEQIIAICCTALYDPANM